MTDARFDRVKLLLKETGLEKLQAATVMVLGLGGVGSNCAEALVRGGIGRLILIDCDVVDITNMNRQAVAYTETIGRTKADVMAEIVYAINPACQVEAEVLELHPDTIAQDLAHFTRPDYVIDCIDSVRAKAAVAAWCQGESLPLVAAMGAANKFDPERLTFSDIRKTSYCPLAKVMRREYRKVGVEHVEVIYSTEPAFKFESEAGADRSTRLGTVSYMPPIMGQMLAGKVIRRLSGLEP